MSIPFNETDYQRLIKLLKLIKEKGNKTEMDIYHSDDFVSIDINSRGLPKDEIENIFKLPIEELLAKEK